MLAYDLTYHSEKGIGNMAKAIEIKEKNVVAEEEYSLLGAVLDKLITYLTRALMFAFKFSFYLCMLFLQLIINVIQYCLDYVFENYFERWDYFIKRREDKERDLMQIEILEDNKTYKHMYKMNRNKQYQEIYEQLEQVIGSAIEYDREIAINKEVAQDVFLKIDRLTQEAERNALEEGYKFCIDTNAKYQNRNIYLEYMREQILKGE